GPRSARDSSPREDATRQPPTSTHGCAAANWHRDAAFDCAVARHGPRTSHPPRRCDDAPDAGSSHGAPCGARPPRASTLPSSSTRSGTVLLGSGAYSSSLLHLAVKRRRLAPLGHFTR